MYEVSQTRREALLEELSDNGWARATKFASADACRDLMTRAEAATWSRLDGDGFSLEIAPLDDPALAEALGASGLRFIRHAVGDHGLPPIAGKGVGGLLDLNADWPSQHGGLLMVTEAGRLKGWRPEQGALTLFDLSRAPVLSMVGRGGPRLAVFGLLAGD